MNEPKVIIRRANLNDTADVVRLLLQNALYHHELRPDIFKKGGKKYDENDFRAFILDENRAVFVAVDKQNVVLGFCFCELILQKGSAINEYLTLYIDDLCVDESCRRLGLGQKLFAAALGFAEQRGAYNVTLNVWDINENAVKFYENLGFTPQIRKMEMILSATM